MNTAVDSVGTNPRVLIADDDESMRLLMEAALQSGGFDIDVTVDGAQAWSTYQRVKPDMVILDVDMPGKDGFEVCQAIRAENDQIPILMVTGCEDTESINRAFNLGATDFVAKPVNWSLIEHRVRYILRGAQTRSALDTSELRNRALIEALPDQLYIMDAQAQVQHAIGSTNSLGANADRDLIGSDFRRQLPPGALPDFERCLSAAIETEDTSTFEFSPESASATEYFECRIVPHEAACALAIVRNVTGRKRTEARIHRLAYFDSLTGLANRHLFLQNANDAIESHGASSRELALIYVGLDDFKRVNDSLGHQTGDKLLQIISRRLAESLQGSGAQLARIAGDEFGILLPDCNQAMALRKARAVNDVITRPLEDAQLNLVLTASIGVSVFPEDGSRLDALLQNAGTALHHAKLSGRNAIRSYTPAMNARASERLKLEGALREALSGDQLTLHFQPRFRTEDLAICGAEALIRWKHPVLGNIPPSDFIPLAEANGQISQVDDWVLHAACRHYLDWQEAGLEPPITSINVSARQFCRDGAARLLTERVRAFDLCPSRFEIEITEGVLMDDAETAKATLGQLRDAGFRIAVDDFGTGYSSLAYLKRFAVDVLKIDRSFVFDVEHGAENQSICRAIISLANGLDLEVVAEGVENEAQYEFLKAEGCQQIQGYWSARPMPAEDYRQFLVDAVRPQVTPARPSA